MKSQNSGTACPPRRSEATAAGGIPAPGQTDDGASCAVTGVSSLTLAAGGPDAAKTPDQERTAPAGRPFSGEDAEILDWAERWPGNVAHYRAGGQ